MLDRELFYLGIPTYRTTIFTPIPLTPQLTISLPKQLPTQIGRIIGLSVIADTVTPDNSPLITTTNAQNLYLFLRDGATEFFETVRLDDMLFNFAGVAAPDGRRYLPVNIPGDFDLSTSAFINPTGIVSAPAPAAATTIALNLWYISTNTYNRLEMDGRVLRNGIKVEPGQARK